MKDKTRQKRERGAEGGFAGMDLEPVIECGSELPPHIPVGDYEASCFDVQYNAKVYGRESVYVWFRITDGEYTDAELYMVCPYYSKVNPRSKLFKQWTIAIARAPRKGDRFSRAVFKHKWFRVKVRSVVRDEHGQPRPPALQYSVVDRIVEPVAGVPELCDQ